VTKLDTRPARTRLLTSRECAKLICAMVVPAAAHFHPEDLRKVLTFIAEEPSVWKLQRLMRKDKPSEKLVRVTVRLGQRRQEVLNTSEQRAGELIFGGLVSGLCSIAKPEVVRDAVSWCVERFDQIAAVE